MIAVFVTTAAVFTQSRFPLLFLPLAVLMVATYRLGMAGAVAGTLIVGTTGTVFVALGWGPIELVHGSIAVQLGFFLFYLVLLYVTCRPLARLLAERSRLAVAYRESDRRHRRILDRSREVIFETDLAGRWTYLNPAWERLTGRSTEQSLGASFLSMVVAEDRPATLERVASLLAQQVQEWRQDVRYARADGEVCWASVRSHLLSDEHGTIVGTYGSIHDVTGRVSAQIARRESERLYRMLADHSNDMIVRFSANGVRQYVSPASLALIGYHPDELVGKPAVGTIHPDDRATVLATCQSLLDGVENPICSYRQLHKDGHYVWLEASYRMIVDETTAAPDGFIASVRDVGRRTQVELERTSAAAKLEKVNRLLLMAESMSGIGHWHVDLATGAAYWSDTVCAIHGRSPGFAPTLNAAVDAYHPDDRAHAQAAIGVALQSGGDYRLSARIVRPDGAVRHVLSHGRAELDPDGSVIGFFGVLQDVTEAKEAERELLAASESLAGSNRMLSMAETVARLGHWRVDDVSGAYFWSEEVYRIYGKEREFIPTFENTRELFHPDDRARVSDTIDTALASGTSYSFKARIIRADGSIAHVFVRGEVDRSASGDFAGLFGILQDVSEQAQGEEKLRAGQARFRLITDQASDMISVQDIDGQCIFMSPAARSILGYEPDEMLGKRPHDFAPVEDHPALDRHSELVRRSLPGIVTTLRFRMRHKAGDLRWMEVAARLADYEGQRCVIAVARDVTSHVESEDALREARTQAEAAVRAKSSFLANMSHEIRTPMNGVVGFTELLLAGELTPDQRRQTELIADSSRAMMRLLNDILDLSKVEAGQMTIASEPFELVHALLACVKLVAPAIEQKGVDLRCAFADDLPRIVAGDGLRLRQVILNLLGNAAKFTLQGSITLRARRTGTTLVIEVEDTGIGIAPDRQAAIFEQFVQADGATAARFGGTGLGLAISNQLAELMGGELTLDSEPGRGTRFMLILPLAGMLTSRPLPSPETEPRVTPAARDPGLRILVAEDHDVNQLLISAMLDKLGCQPDLAADGYHAVAMVIEAHAVGRPYSLAFMDVQMPEMDGLEATRRIRAAGIDAATLPIVALTANAYSDDIDACLDAGMQAHVPKPFSLATLQAAMRRWLPAAPLVEPEGPTPLSPQIEERYRARKQETLQRLDGLLRAGTFEDMELQDVAAMLHKLGGTAEMFGDVTLGIEARLLETGLESWAPADRRERIVRGIEAIQRAA